jgi:hypothetical protein
MRSRIRKEHAPANQQQTKQSMRAVTYTNFDDTMQHYDTWDYWKEEKSIARVNKG